MEDIQFQHDMLADMMLGITEGGTAKTICLGIPRYRHMDQKHIHDTPLDRVQHLIWDR